MSRRYVAVVGASFCGPEQAVIAEEAGRRIAEAGSILVCGGLGGVMEAACAGAKAAGGTTVGILPGTDRADANRWIDVAIPTGMGEGRNALVVRSADALVAVGGEYGTLSEIALALKAGTPVVGIGTWELRKGGRPDGAIVRAADAREAATRALELAAAGSR